MELNWVLITRLVVAGLFGGLIGLERELRAKEAGVRTHFIVALGSALFMIISQFAFEGKQHDAARVAAQVVSGIGFIGAGVIIFQQNAVRGITTAAGLWVAAAIGMACGDGMYVVALSATLLTIFVMEMMHFINLHLSEKAMELILAPPPGFDPLTIPELLKQLKIKVESFSYDNGQVHLMLRFRHKDHLAQLKAMMEQLEGFTIVKIN